ncbi:MAG: glycyl radical protein [Oscillospiraceae bacterium]|jgi:formate C-acetyltransferase|nr:glycyl radical protein [Oscillospiraceae bacterium]
MTANETSVIAKGFTKPTARVERLKRAIVEAVPVMETERAKLVTEAYKETENLAPILRRAKVVEKLFNHMQVTIRDDELIVGTTTEHPRSSEVGIEYSYDWIEQELDTLSNRATDPFCIDETGKKTLRKISKYWQGKTLSEYALSLMSKECRDCQDYAVFNAGNYLYAGVGHSVVFYERVIKDGFSGIIRDVVDTLEKMDRNHPDAIKKEQFYRALLITYTAAINHAHRYANKAEEMAQRETNPARKAELAQIAKNCRRVPEHGATTFWEAVQSFWFVHYMLHVEANGHSYSPGPFDRFMHRFYQSDPTVTEDFAQELIDCLFVKFNDANKVRDDISAQAFAGYQLFELVALGGTDEDGNDQTNDISYMCLTALAHVGMPMPSVGIRVGNTTPDEFLYRACEVIRLGYGMPNVFNDEVIIPAMVNRGIPLKLARTYTPSGCVEPDIQHKYEGWHDAASFNVAKVLEITLHNGRCFGKQLGPQTGEITSFTCIEDFFAAFEKQMAYFVHNMVEAVNCIDVAHGDRVPLPFQSALIEGCIEKGKSVQEGGALYNFTGPQGVGIIDAGDSLYAIQKNVFEDKKITLAQLKDALENNFGHPVEATGSTEISAQNGAAAAGGALSEESEMEMRIYEAVKSILSGSGSISLADLRKSASLPQTAGGGQYDDILRVLRSTPGFGNDIDEVDAFTVRCGRIYCELVEQYTNPRGGKFQAGMYPVSANVLYGKDVGALPTGRLAKTTLGDGVSPRAGVDTNGPTAAANSVSKLDHALASNGTLYNQKFLPAALTGDKGLMNLSALIRGYFDRKGMHIQFNVVDRETLLDAQKNPDKHKDLVIRVAGYSAHFVRLAKDVQDNIINRTEHTF